MLFVSFKLLRRKEKEKYVCLGEDLCPIKVEPILDLNCIHNRLSSGISPSDLIVNKSNVISFKFFLINPDICPSASPIDILIFVKSTLWKAEKRKAIRETWCNRTAWFRETGLRTNCIFLMGIDGNETNDNKPIENEFSQFRDLLQANFTEAYYNNTMKMMVALEFATKNCPHAKYYILVDDDFFVNIKHVALKMSLIAPGKYTNYIGGRVKYNDPPIRDKKYKNQISMDEYPYSRYPPVLQGGFIIISKPMFHRIAFVLPYTKWFKIDDVYLSIVACKMGIEIENIIGVCIISRICQSTPISWLTAAHGFNTTELLINTWKELMHESKS